MYALTVGRGWQSPWLFIGCFPYNIFCHHPSTLNPCPSHITHTRRQVPFYTPCKNRLLGCCCNCPLSIVSAWFAFANVEHIRVKIEVSRGRKYIPATSGGHSHHFACIPNLNMSWSNYRFDSNRCQGARGCREATRFCWCQTRSHNRVKTTKA